MDAQPSADPRYLQPLGFRYHIDEASGDEPFIVPLKGGDFVTVPYTFHINDDVSYPFLTWNPAAYEQALKMSSINSTRRPKRGAG